MNIANDDPDRFDPFEHVWPSDAADLMMMLMAGGDKEEFRRIRDVDPFVSSFRLYMLQYAATYRPPRQDHSGEY